jgi:prephenate dehydrogenase
VFQRLCIIGVGLIGGSLARALRVAGSGGEIVGCGRDPERLQLACDLGVIDSYETDIAAAVAGADLVVIATPLGAMADLFAALGAHLEPGCLVTDVGSAKGSVVADARAKLSSTQMARFIPGHPIAGTEKSGVEASFAELFNERRVILTPLDENLPESVARIRAMWEAAGSEVTEMSVAHHDTVLAATSHLPHMLAYTLVDTLARMHDKDEIFGYAAGGFRDFTRIASSDPVMWRDVCVANRAAILSMINRFQADLALLAEAIEGGDTEVISEVFNRAKAARDRYAGRLDANADVIE